MSYVDPLPPTPGPDRPTTLDEDTQAFLDALVTFRTQVNALPGIVASAAQSGGFALAYIFSATTTTADPGPGLLRLNNATQSSATAAYLDLLDALGNDVSGRLARVAAGTSAIKGELAIYKVADGRKWLSFEATLATSPTGYRSVVLQNGVGSSTSPFADGDGVMVTWTRWGDKGDIASYQNDGALVTVSGSPNLLTFSGLPNVGSNYKLDLNLSLSTGTTVSIALSVDGTTFGSPRQITTTAGSVWGSILIHDYRGDRPRIETDWNSSAPSNLAGTGFTKDEAIWLATGGVSAFRLSPGAGNFVNGGTAQRRYN